MHNKSGGEPASEDKALRRQSALSILENAIVFCTNGAQILSNGKGPFLFVINDLVPVLRDHGMLGLLDALASQIFGYPDDPKSGELRHSTAISSGYVPLDQVLRTVLSISRAFGLEEAMDRLSGPEGEGLVSTCICMTLSCLHPCLLLLLEFGISPLASHVHLLLVSKSQLKIVVRAAAQEGGEAFAATVRRLFDKETDGSLTRDERALLAHLRKCWTLAGENSAEEWRRLLELEKAGKLSPADEIKLTNWRAGLSAGGENSAEEWRRLLRLEKAGKLSPADKIKLTNWRAGELAGGENRAEEWRRLLELEEADELGPDDKIKLTEWRVGKSAGGLAGGLAGDVSEGKRAEWNQMYALLRDYKEENGNCLVTQNRGDKKLARWVSTQRGQYRLKDDGKRSTLSSEREVLLDKIGFTWKINPSWNDRFQQLENVGSCKGPVINAIDTSLYSWCAYQVHSRQLWEKNEREYQRQLSSWKKSRRRGDRPTRRDQTKYEKWIKREELLDQLGFWNQFRST